LIAFSHGGTDPLSFSGSPSLWLRPPEAEQKQMRTLMQKYKDTPMDLADASLVTAAEVLNVTRIFTTDSDFYIYQIGGTKPFEVLP